MHGLTRRHHPRAFAAHTMSHRLIATNAERNADLTRRTRRAQRNRNDDCALNFSVVLCASVLKTVFLLRERLYDGRHVHRNLQAAFKPGC